MMLLVTDGDRFANNTFDQQYFDSGYQHSSMYLPGSESQASFQHIAVKTSSFNHLDTSQASKKVNRQSVAHTPVIHAVVDTSLVNRVLDSIPGTSLTELLQVLYRITQCILRSQRFFVGYIVSASLDTNLQICRNVHFVLSSSN